MAGVVKTRRFDLAKVDSWFAVLQWLWDRAYAFVASAVGAAAIANLARATDWVSRYGPLAWGLVGLVAFTAIYLLLVYGRRVLAKARLDRAHAMIAERTAEHATVNPLADDYRNQRIRLVDLYTPFGAPLRDRTFRRCDLVGPAVIWLSTQTTFTANRFDNVEFVKINANTAQCWPNKLALVGGSIHECYLVNVIIIVHDEHATDFAATFSSPIQWMNDPIDEPELPGLQGARSETQQ